MEEWRRRGGRAPASTRCDLWMASESDVESHNQRAQRLWELGRREEALGVWKQAHALDPDNVDAMLGLAWALSREGKVSEGLRLAKRATDEAPEEWRCHHLLGQIRYQLGEYDAAVTAYRRALGVEGADPYVYSDLGDSLYSCGQFADAAEAYSQLLSVHPDDAYAHLWRGWSLQQLDGNEESSEHFRRALELSPDWPEALYAVGQAYCAQHKFARALELLRAALDGYPEEDEEGRAAAACELGNAHRGLGDLTRAAELYRMALSLDPTHSTARFNLGMTYTDLHEFDSAIKELTIVVQFDPEDVDALCERGNAFLALERYDEAMADYERALALRPECGEALAGLGLTYYMMGLYDLSAEQYQRAVPLAQEDPWPSYNMGLALAAGGRFSEAEKAFEEAFSTSRDDAELCASVARALAAHGRNIAMAVRAGRQACEIAPTSPDAQDSLAAAFLAAGDSKSAFGPASEAVRLAPEVAEYVFNLALVQRELHDSTGARKSLVRVLQLAPDFDEARELLRQLEHDL